MNILSAPDGDAEAHTDSGSGVMPVASGIAFSPDGTRLATAGDDGTIRLWDVATRREVAALAGHEVVIHALAFNPDRTKLA